MSVLIKGMKMPKTCKECDIETTDCWCGVVGEYTDSVRRIGSNRYNGRFETCPLVEVKVPHGNLLDRDDIKANMLPLSFSVRKWIDEVTLDLKIPVVIKAERVEAESQGCNDDGYPIFFGDQPDEPEEGAEDEAQNNR